MKKNIELETMQISEIPEKVTNRARWKRGRVIYTTQKISDNDLKSNEIIVRMPKPHEPHFVHSKNKTVARRKFDFYGQMKKVKKTDSVLKAIRDKKLELVSGKLNKTEVSKVRKDVPSPDGEKLTAATDELAAPAKPSGDNSP